MNFFKLAAGTIKCVTQKVILVILLFNIPLVSSHAQRSTFEQALLQVEYFLMENDTQAALRSLNWLLASPLEEEIQQRCQLRKLSLVKPGAIAAFPDMLVDSLQRLKFLPDLIQARQRLLQGEWKAFYTLLHKLAPLPGHQLKQAEGCLPSTQQLLAWYKQMLPCRYQSLYFSFLANEYLQFGNEIMQEREGDLKAGDQLRPLQYLLVDLLDEVIRQLFLSFFDPAATLNPFYLQFNHYRNLITFNQRRQVYYSLLLKQCFQPRFQGRLDELYELNYLLLERAGRSGLMNKNRKRLLTDQLQLNEKMLLHYVDRYQLTKTDYWFKKLWQVTDIHKNTIWWQKRRFYGTPGLLKELGRSLIYDVEKTEQQLRELDRNEQAEEFIKLSIYLSKRYQAYLRVFNLLTQQHQSSKLGSFGQLSDLVSRNRSSVIAYTESSHFFLGISLGSNGKKLKLIPKDSILMAALTASKTQFRQVKDLSGINKKDLTVHYDNAHFLYNQLVGPLIGEHFPSELLIIPDGELCYLPFGTLVVKPPGAGGRNPEYLIQFSRLRYYASGRRLTREYASSIVVKAHDLLAIAPDYRNGSDTPMAYPDLKGSRRELATIAKIFPTARLDFKTLKKKELLGQDLQKKMLHFAMHGTDQENGLVFSADGQEVLMPYELADLEEAPTVVVLGACYSGLGRYIPGEGPESIGQKFLEIGTRGVLVGLSALEDRVSAELLSSFYHLVANGYSGAEALQKAKIRYLQRADTYWQQPILWGGLVFYGEDFHMEP